MVIISHKPYLHKFFYTQLKYFLIKFHALLVLSIQDTYVKSKNFKIYKIKIKILKLTNMKVI